MDKLNQGIMKAQYFTHKSYHQASGKELLCQMSFLLGPFLPRVERRFEESQVACQSRVTRSSDKNNTPKTQKSLVW